MASDEEKEKRRAYYVANRDRIQAWRQRYYAANRERINAQRRSYKARIRLNDPIRWERILEKEREGYRRRYQGDKARGIMPTKTPAERRAYYAANKEHITETRKRWRSRPEVRERENARVRADRAANPEKYRRHDRRKRAKRREQRAQGNADG